MKIFTIYDSKAEAFLPPFYERSTGLAVRAFEDAANNSEHQFNKYPSDYTLFELGEFNETTAEFTHLKAHINLGLAVIFIHEAPVSPIALHPPKAVTQP